MPHIDFKGKANIRNHHLAIPHHELTPDKNASMLPRGVRPNLNGNILINADNLLALKALLPTHAGKVDVIYIDPPYNTGSERWVYNDKVDNPMMREWLGKAVDKEDLTRHDKWCCMMWPRLQVLHELLHDDGIIFVSIDDNELHRLRNLLDEIFGAENFRNMIVVRRYDKNISRQFAEKGQVRLAVGAEYILAYSKSASFSYAPVFRPAKGGPRPTGYWKGFWNNAERPTMQYELLGVKPTEGQWKWCREVAESAVLNYDEYIAKHNHLTLEEYWENTGKKKRFIRRRERLTRGKSRGVEHWIHPSDKGVLVSSHWDDLLASKKFQGIEFNAPKNVEIIERLLSFVGKQDALILDSFAGSGTTAHAVISSNQRDGGTRRFILIECEAYARQTTAKRIRTVIEQLNVDSAQRPGFTFYTLGAPLVPKSLLSGQLPSWEELARYVFYSSTGENLALSEMDQSSYFVGASKRHNVYLMYEPNLEFLRTYSLTLEEARKLSATRKRKRYLIFAPNKFADSNALSEMGIDYCRLPFEIMSPELRVRKG